MTFFEGFTAFNFDEGVPYVSVTKNGVTFNKSVVMKLGYPSHVVLLINAETKQIAIKVCDEGTPNSTLFYKERINSKTNASVLSVRWNAKDLLNTIQGITGWSLESDVYRVEGILIKEENAMLFDLKKARIFD